jgi:hypothetical protein
VRDASRGSAGSLAAQRTLARDDNQNWAATPPRAELERGILATANVPTLNFAKSAKFRMGHPAIVMAHTRENPIKRLGLSGTSEQRWKSVSLSSGERGYPESPVVLVRISGGWWTVAENSLARAWENSLTGVGQFELVGVLRLRNRSAARSSCSAQDDKIF